ncbi:MAG: hypothetical protein HZC02_00770 [Candidatus Levybacteria bacterium]|nr:hypothetical protein [Candidatus Levybacteria bacterium]
MIGAILLSSAVEIDKLQKEHEMDTPFSSNGRYDSKLGGIRSDSGAFGTRRRLPVSLADLDMADRLGKAPRWIKPVDHQEDFTRGLGGPLGSSRNGSIPFYDNLSDIVMMGMAPFSLDGSDWGQDFDSSSIMGDFLGESLGDLSSLLDDQLSPAIKLSLTLMQGDTNGVTITSIVASAHRCPGCGRIHEIHVVIVSSMSCPVHGMHTDNLSLTIVVDDLEELLEDILGDIDMLNGYVPSELYQLLPQL